LICRTILSALLAALAGCAYVEERFTDVSNDPRYAVGYRSGESLRLRADGRLVVVASNGCLPGKATERLELWSPAIIARNAAFPDYGRVVAVVPAGSVVHVDGAEYNYTFAIPPVPGDSEILRSYGTVESTAGRWTHVRIPDDVAGPLSFVPGTHVMTFAADRAFLEPVPAAKGG